MSWNPCLEPQCPDAGNLDAIETLIVPGARDLGGFEAVPGCKVTAESEAELMLFDLSLESAS